MKKLRFRRPLRVDEGIRLELVKHRTTSDWAFQSTSWTLDSVTYVSAPSSVRFTSYGNAALLHASVSGNIGQGRIVSKVRFYRSRFTGHSYTFIFRNQGADPGWALQNCYFLSLEGSTAVLDADIDRACLRYVLAGSGVDIETHVLSPTLAQNTWYSLRVTFWESAGVLMVRLEYWDGSAWVDLCDEWADPNNRWSGTATNRVGVGAVRIQTPYNTWHDDTEIYMRV